MGIGNRETIRPFKYLMILAIVLTLTSAVPPSDITYNCDKKGITSIQNSDYTHFAIISGGPSNRKYCKPSGENFLATCPEAQHQKSITLLYEDVKPAQIIGGKTPTYYRLNCNDGATLDTQIGTFTAQSQEKNSSVLNHNVTHRFELHLIKGDGEGTGPITVNIGDKLTLQMTGTDVVISPQICYAYPKDDRPSKVTIWELFNNNGNKECRNNDKAIIGSAKWSKKDAAKPDIEIELYAFRFIKKNEVVVECSALVCSTQSKAGCLQTCVGVTPTIAPLHVITTKTTMATTPSTQKPSTKDSRKRKRRGIVRKDDSRRIRSSSVSFSVRDNEALLNSSPGLSMGNTKFLAVGLALMFVILPRY